MTPQMRPKCGRGVLFYVHVEVAQRQLQHVELAVDLALPRVARQRAEVVHELARFPALPRALQHARGGGPLDHAVVRGHGLPRAQHGAENVVREVQARARRHGHVDLALARKEFAALECLMDRRGGLVTKSQLIDHIYGIGEDASEGNVEVLISRLRKKLMPHDIEIRVARGLGYHIKAPE